jgi:DNA (cytosine-5)-methyltransferase 1
LSPPKKSQKHHHLDLHYFFLPTPRYGTVDVIYSSCMTTAYYNENDPYAAQWLRNLIAEKLIAPGDVDDRSILDVRPKDLRNYAQCHFFAGIGGWSRALRLAHIPDDRPLWTGSCPCQPFSAAGKGLGFADERHLWPYWFHLIEQCRPPVLFGEQVASPTGLTWFDLVRADLEDQDYAVGASDLCAASVGAPHIRQRLWFVADARCGSGATSESRLDRAPQGRRKENTDSIERDSANGLLADADGRDTSTEGLQRGGEHGQRAQDGRSGVLADPEGEGFARSQYAGTPSEETSERTRMLGIGGRREAGSMGNTSGAGLQERERDGRFQRGALEPSAGQAAIGRSDAWDCDWLPCTDGKSRPVEPGTFPLAHGIPARVAKLRALGNAIVPQVAAEFILAALNPPPLV